MFEDELVPLLEQCGRLYEVRIIIDVSTGENRGYAFVVYCSKKDAESAIRQCNGFEIRPGRRLGVCASVANRRLFVGPIPKQKNRDEIFQEFKGKLRGLVEVFAYMDRANRNQNRGYVFVEFESYQAASNARRLLRSGQVMAWGSVVSSDWAEPMDEPTEEVMATVRRECCMNACIG